MPVTTRASSQKKDTEGLRDNPILDIQSLRDEALQLCSKALNALDIDTRKVFSSRETESWTENGDLHIGVRYTINGNVYAVSLFKEPLLPVKVDDARLFEPYDPDSDLTVAPDDLYNDSVYIKQSVSLRWIDLYSNDASVQRPRLIREVRVLERLLKTPHPHIVRYFGCYVADGLVKGIVLEKLPLSLNDYDADRTEFKDMDVDFFLSRLESTVAFLHSLGLAHNDIKPGNVLVRDGLPVLIDFEGCCAFGESPTMNGSPGWTEGGLWQTSNKDNDLYGLQLIRKRISNKDEVATWFRL